MSTTTHLRAAPETRRALRNLAYQLAAEGEIERPTMERALLWLLRREDQRRQEGAQ